MGKVLAGLEELDLTLRSAASHRLLGSGSVHASLIEGGQELSSYPERCFLGVERRTIPGETMQHIEAELPAIFARIAWSGTRPRRAPMFSSQCAGTRVAGIAHVVDDDQLLLITEQGMIIRTRVRDLRSMGRSTQGVIVMRIQPDDQVITLAPVGLEEEERPA